MHRMVFVLTLAGGAILMAACDEETTAPAERYVVQLTGAKERPNPVPSTATGTATVTVVDQNTITLEIAVSNLNEVVAGHFHAGDENTAGPVIHGFLANATPSGLINGPLVSSTITRQSTFNTNAGFTFDSLLTRMRAGTTYLNLHTRTYPGGEIRGQVKK